MASVLPDAQALAETYAGGDYEDPWDAVRQYRAYEAYVAEHPDHGRWKVADAIDVPRARVASWMQGNMPPPARLVDTAESLGWLPLDPDDETFAHCNVLVAGVFAGGAINTNWRPSWHVGTDATETLLTEAIAGLGLEPKLDHRDEDHGAELTVGDHGSLLGRLLYTLGAPKGEKNIERDLTLPTYLFTVSAELRTEWVRTYWRMRGTLIADPNSPGAWLRVRERRSTTYLTALASFFRVTLPEGEDITVSHSGKQLYISRAAVEALFDTAYPEV